MKPRVPLVPLCAAAVIGMIAGTANSVPTEHFTYPIDLVADRHGWPSSDFPFTVPALGTSKATVTVKLDLASSPPPDGPVRFHYVLHPVPIPPPCPPAQCKVGGICYHCPSNLTSIELGQYEGRHELSNQMIDENGLFWNVHLWTFDGEPGARLTGTARVTVQRWLAIPDPEIIVTEPPAEETLIAADRRLQVAWTRVGKMSRSVHIDLLAPRGRLTQRLASATANDGQESVVIPRRVAAGNYRVRVETVDGKVSGESGVVLVPPA